MMTRRHALKLAAFTTAFFSTSAKLVRLEAQPAPASGPYQLPPLPYAFDALEPHIDARTMEIHHGKHHAGYVANLNKAVEGHPRLARRSVEELIRGLRSIRGDVRTAIQNHGGGHYNHTLFWQMMTRDGGGAPKGELAAAIEKQFGSFDAFKSEFSKSAGSVFGSGWAWLTLDESKQLRVETTPNQNNPLSEGRVPLLGIDVWEHAYYLKYQNKRADYIAAWFNVVNWDFVAERFKQAAA
jgi:Fe-Mn family superoxide dismutase